MRKIRLLTSSELSHIYITWSSMETVCLLSLSLLLCSFPATNVACLFIVLTCVRYGNRTTYNTLFDCRLLFWLVFLNLYQVVKASICLKWIRMIANQSLLSLLLQCWTCTSKFTDYIFIVRGTSLTIPITNDIDMSRKPFSLLVKSLNKCKRPLLFLW